MNLQQIEKHYDKLTARERFALMMAAQARGDQGTQIALGSSAPTVTFEFSHCKGLADGFEDLTRYHAMQQLGTAGTFFMLVYLQSDDGTNQFTATINGEEVTTESAITLCARRYLEGLEAYHAVCQEYDIDPEYLEENYLRYPELLAFTELIVRRGFDLSKTELTDLEATKQSYRKVIDQARERWAEARAR